MTCSCGRIKIGSTITETRNWNPNCKEHGVKSDWYNSDEQIEKRAIDNARLRDLQKQAKEARAKARQQRYAGSSSFSDVPQPPRRHQ